MDIDITTLYRALKARGWTTGYRRASVAERFSAMVIRHPVGCWEWAGSHKTSGYGQMTIPGDSAPEGAHRVAYTLFVGPIPRGLHVLHTCDNRGCVNPAHLYVGTNADNVRDKVARNRQSRVVPAFGSSHPNAKLSEDAVIQIRASSETCAALGRKYGVSKCTISKVKRGSAWTRAVPPSKTTD